MQYKPVFIHGDTARITFVLNVEQQARAIIGLRYYGLDAYADKNGELVVTLRLGTPKEKLYESYRIVFLTGVKGVDPSEIR